ncbi:hypothetical protein NDU88_006308 [Pleurodeles waltl]|uniref:Uncharacterized protein n=1 Tax=Pleurodeles waltl TaxID=8319 RepID=A0AAV7WEB2_PLEWA|nr:hypothetical protein NDU88_006308 [Pleurodeles waltl]
MRGRSRLVVRQVILHQCPHSWDHKKFNIALQERITLGSSHPARTQDSQPYSSRISGRPGSMDPHRRPGDFN